MLHYVNKGFECTSQKSAGFIFANRNTFERPEDFKTCERGVVKIRYLQVRTGHLQGRKFKAW